MLIKKKKTKNNFKILFSKQANNWKAKATKCSTFQNSTPTGYRILSHSDRQTDSRTVDSLFYQCKIAYCHRVMFGNKNRLYNLHNYWFAKISGRHTPRRPGFLSETYDIIVIVNNTSSTRMFSQTIDAICNLHCKQLSACPCLALFLSSIFDQRRLSNVLLLSKLLLFETSNRLPFVACFRFPFKWPRGPSLPFCKHWFLSFFIF